MTLLSVSVCLIPTVRFLWPGSTAGGRQRLRPGAVDRWPDGRRLALLSAAADWRTLKGSLCTFVGSLEQTWLISRRLDPIIYLVFNFETKATLGTGWRQRPTSQLTGPTRFRPDPSGTRHPRLVQKLTHLSAADESLVHQNWGQDEPPVCCEDVSLASHWGTERLQICARVLQSDPVRVC